MAQENKNEIEKSPETNINLKHELGKTAVESFYLMFKHTQAS